MVALARLVLVDVSVAPKVIVDEEELYALIGEFNVANGEMPESIGCICTDGLELELPPPDPPLLPELPDEPEPEEPDEPSLSFTFDKVNILLDVDFAVLILGADWLVTIFSG